MNKQSANDPRPRVKIFRPAYSVNNLVWDLLPGTMGVSLFLGQSGHWAANLAGAFFCLLSLGLLHVSWMVHHTYVGITRQAILSAGPLSFWSLRWSEIHRVVIRQRPQTLATPRAARVVQLFGPGDDQLVVNSSVFTPPEEAALLTEIRSRINCPVEEHTDGPFDLPKPGGGKP